MKRAGFTRDAGAPIAAGRHNLPARLTSFVGRERELGELRKALAATRLLTLTGPGGCGKTRLALRIASELEERFPGGVCWVELAPLADEELVGATVAEALGVRPLPGMTELQACAAYLASRRALVILDNCEHLLGPCAVAAEALLLAGPEVVVLATSRAPLGVAGETDWRVPSLSLPGPGADLSKLGLDGSDAVSLFVERARRGCPEFAVSGENAEYVARICEGLDGLPLAIELGAARVRMMSVQQIASGVSEGFRLLTGGPRTALERHQTLRASMDWSHGLLSAEEQMLLRRVAVFAGGFTLEAVEQVCAGDGLDSDQMLDLLASLVDQSLVIVAAREPRVRYRVLETVRQYGVERLAATDESARVRDRHLDFFLTLAEDAAPHLETGRQREYLQRLNPESANLAAAIDHALGSEPVLALRFCAALWRWWSARGRLAEAELAQARALEASGDREPALRARVLHGRAYLAMFTGEPTAAELHAAESLALADQTGDRSTAARARCLLGAALQYAHPSVSRTELGRAAELARAAGDDWALVDAKQIIALTYLYQGDHGRATAANNEVSALAEQLGDPHQVSRRWLWAARMAHFDGRFTEARDAGERSRSAVDATEEPVMEALAEDVVALVAVSQGDRDRPLARLNEQLERSLRLGAGMVVPWLLTTIAFAELSAGRLERARDTLNGLIPMAQGRWAFLSSRALGLLAETERLLDDGAAESTALKAQASGERIGNKLLATRARLTLGRLAAARGDFADAQQHVLAHLDACAEGGHASFVPACLDALGELAAGVGAHEDAVRLLAAGQRGRVTIGAVRIPPEERHWAALDGALRETLGDAAYEAARAQGARLTLEEALEWARRARGPRDRPAGGWESLTPTELRVAALVSEGLTNPQIGERMFISKATVKAHVAHIFNKLDIHTRAELTARAVGRAPPR